MKLATRSRRADRRRRHHRRVCKALQGLLGRVGWV